MGRMFGFGHRISRQNWDNKIIRPKAKDSLYQPHCESQLGDCGRRVWSRRKIYDHAGMGHGYSRSVPEGQGPIFLQAVGRGTEEAGGSHA